MPQSCKVVPTPPTLMCHEAVVIWKKTSTMKDILGAVNKRREKIRMAEIVALEVEIDALKARHTRNSGNREGIG